MKVSRASREGGIDFTSQWMLRFCGCLKPTTIYKNGKCKNVQKDAKQVWNSYILSLRYTKPKLTELKAET